MQINNNVAAFNAYRNLSVSQGQLGKSLEKLSSGFRINRAADDASGLVISEGLRSQIGGLRQATRNAQDGVSVVQTAEGALTEVHSMLQRMRDLAVQVSSTGTYGDDAKAAAQAEFDQLSEEINRISTSTKFGDKVLFDGSLATVPGTAATSGTSTVKLTPGGDGSENFQLKVTVGGDEYTTAVIAENASAGAIQTALAAATKAGGGALSAVASVSATADGSGGVDLSVTTTATGTAATIGDISMPTVAGNDASLGTASSNNGAAAAAESGGAVFQVGAFEGDTIRVGINSLDTASLGIAGITDLSAAGTLDAIDGAIGQVSTQRGSLGAVQNRFEHTVANLQVAVENLTASESRIRDTDMAAEMTTFTRNQIMQQAGTAMLAQANQLPQSVLSLLR